MIGLSKRFVGGEGIFYPKFHGICSVVESIPGVENDVEQDKLFVGGLCIAGVDVFCGKQTQFSGVLVLREEGWIIR